MGESLSSAGGSDELRFRPSASPVEVERLRQYLTDAMQRGATDIHLRAGDAVYARIEGKLTLKHRDVAFPFPLRDNYGGHRIADHACQRSGFRHEPVDADD